MRLKEGFMLKEIAGTWVVVPIGQRVVEFGGMMTLSESGAELWRKLESETDMEELVNVLINSYDIDKETARGDVDQFLSSLREKGLLG